MERKNVQGNEDNFRSRDTDLLEFLLETGDFPNDDIDASLAMVWIVCIW